MVTCIFTYVHTYIHVRKSTIQFYCNGYIFTFILTYSHTYIYIHGIALDLMKKLLAFHPDDRLTVQQALEHPYLKG